MDEAPFAARVGTTVQSQWHLDSLLGVGGMAAVYAATGPDGLKVALKILHHEYKDDPKILVRFRREAEVATLVSHPALVRVHEASFVTPVLGDNTEPSRSDAGSPDDASSAGEEGPTTERGFERDTELVRTEEGEPFLVMDLLDGESIRDEWRRKGRTLPLQDALHIAERVVDCLIACHDAGVIHRDLKPANLFRTRDGDIKVLDFGVAQVQGSLVDLNAQGTALGTPAYIAPEQAMGLAAQLDGRSDLFSVGAVLHALITGHRLHAARTPHESLILAATKSAPSIVRIAPNLPQPVVRLVDKALAWDRRQRFADAREMHEAILAAATLAQAWDDDALDQALAPPPESLAPRPLLLSPELSPRHSISLAPNADVTSVKEAFALVNDVLTAAREFEWTHPASARALGRAHDALTRVLADDPTWGKLTLRPYAFASRGVTIWEPPPPFDGIPHHLFAAGVRTLEIAKDINEAELRELLTVLMLDPEEDLLAEDDHATILCERDLPNVSFATTELSPGGDATSRARFWRDAEDWQRTIEDHAALVADKSEFEPIVLTPDESEAIVARLAEDEREVPSRHVAAVARAYAHVAARGDAAPILRALRAASEAELAQGNFDAICTFFENMCGELRAILTAPSTREPLLVALADALFGGSAFVLLGRYLGACPSDIVLARPILELLGPSELPRALDAARDARGELRELFLGYVERVGREHEEEVASAAEGLDSEGTYAILETLQRVGTDAGHVILKRLTESTDAALRVSARVVRSGNAESAALELAHLLSDPSALTRIQALRIAQCLQVETLKEPVAKLVAEAAPAESDEILERMRTLLVLGGRTAEAQVVDVAKKGGFFVSQSRELARVAACTALSEVSFDRHTADTLATIAKARLGTSDDVRKAAKRAARAIHERADANDADELEEAAS